MVTFLDAVNRAITGKPCSERDYDLRIFATKLRELIKEYDIKYDPESSVISDDSLADDVFRAAIDLYREVGVYCKDTERIIRFDESEIKEGLKNAPSQASFGEGKDTKIMVPRKPEDKTPPWCFIGAGGAPVTSEEVLLSLVQSYGSIPLADSITTPALTSVDGTRIRTSSPLEIYGAIRNAVLAREALRRAGRPGLPIMNALATAESAPSLIAALHPQYGLRPSDGYLLAALAELKVDFDRLNKACALLNLGGRIVGEAGPVFGGYCGGPEGTAITSAAYHILGVLVYQATCNLVFPIHLKHRCSTAPGLSWVISTYGQAISRNTHLLSLNLTYTAAGPCTEMVLHEIAARVITAVISGLSIEAVGVAKAIHEDYLTPIEPRFAAEVAHATAASGIKREDANEIVKHLESLYKDKLSDPPSGTRYQECFDMKTGKPSPR
ncbi:MAG: monomethylamine:corrinoid methyltransferase, partial [Candidatus Bathyarchaeota archaeon]